ncbi:hypothetical protein X975_13304, partial [Stegodyphus mimosarum]
MHLLFGIKIFFSYNYESSFPLPFMPIIFVISSSMYNQKSSTKQEKSSSKHKMWYFMESTSYQGHN